MKLKRIVFLLLAMLALMCVSAQAEDMQFPFLAETNELAVNLRSEMSTKSSAVGRLERGMRLNVLAEQINACRADAGLEPLSVSTKLCGIAAARAWEISASWSHTRPDGRGWKSVLGDYGYGYGTASEQLAHTSGYDAASIVSSWMGSSSNSAELLNPAYTTIGVGVYSAGGSVFLAAILIG